MRLGFQPVNATVQAYGNRQAAGQSAVAVEVPNRVFISEEPKTGGGDQMKSYKLFRGLLMACCLMVFMAGTASPQEKAAAGAVQVHVVITAEAERADREVPVLQQGDVRVTQGKTALQVAQLIPAKGDNTALQLFILVDDTLDAQVGNNLTDLREFISAQPATTLVGVGYMSNAGVNMGQNFTPDHALAAKALRLPRGSLSSMDSPYLSLISLVKGWPQQNVRREVLMVTDGIDRLRGEQPTASQLGPRFGPAYHSMPNMSPDVNSASEASQRYNVIVHSLYAVGVGRSARSSWDLQIGLSGLSKLADETGGECFSLGTSNAVSFKPYLERLQKIFDNQYYLVFLATPGKKPGLQRVKIATEVSNVEIAAPDNVWVSAGK
jgi:hypothetical protein